MKLSYLSLIFYFFDQHQSIGCLELPDAFSFSRSNHVIKDSSKNLLETLNNYELKTYVNVILLGRGFNVQSSDVKNLENSLVNNITQSLLKLSSRERMSEHSFFKHQFEKIELMVQHDQELEHYIRSQSKEILQNDIRMIDFSHLEMILENSHNQHNQLNEGVTTLFILYDLFPRPYTYPTEFNTCPQRTFMSQSNFAWIDITTDAQLIEPIHPTTNLLGYHPIENYHLHGGSEEYYELSTLIYRSIESLIPLPIYPASITTKSTLFYDPKSFANRKDLLIITICIDQFQFLKRDCIDDINATYENTRDIIRQYSLPHSEVTLTTITLKLSEEMNLLHVFHNAIDHPYEHPHVFSNQQSIKIKLSLQLLMEGVMENDLIGHILSTMSPVQRGDGDQVDRIVYPVFLFVNPHNVQMYITEDEEKVQYQSTLDLQPPALYYYEPSESAHHNSIYHNYQLLFEDVSMRLSNTHPPEHGTDADIPYYQMDPPTTWYYIDSLYVSHTAGLYKVRFPVIKTLREGTIQWPTRGEFVIRNTNQQLHVSSLHANIGLQCNGKHLFTNEWYLDEQLSYDLQMILSDIPPPYLHYSASSQDFVTDYLWHTAPVTCTGSTAVSNVLIHGCFKNFRQMQVVQRNIFMRHAEKLLITLHDLLVELVNLIPNITLVEVLSFSMNMDPMLDQDGSNPLHNSFQYRKKYPSKVGNSSSSNQKASLFEEFLNMLDDAAVEFSLLKYDEAFGLILQADTHVQYMMERIRGYHPIQSIRIQCQSPNLSTTPSVAMEEESSFFQTQRSIIPFNSWTYNLIMMAVILIALLFGFIIGYYETSDNKLYVFVALRRPFRRVKSGGLLGQ